MKPKRKQKRKINLPVLDFVTPLSLEECARRLNALHNPPRLIVHPPPRREEPLDYAFVMKRQERPLFAYEREIVTYQINVTLESVARGVHVVARITPNTLDHMQSGGWQQTLILFLIGCFVSVSLGLSTPLALGSIAIWVAVLYVLSRFGGTTARRGHLGFSPVSHLLNDIRAALYGPVL